MCPSADYEHEHEHEHGLQPRHRPRRLNFNCLFLGLPCSGAGAGAGASSAALPESLSLVFLPRMKGSPLHVNCSKIRADTPAFLTLHRVLTSTSDFDVVFAARDHVRASDGLTFEVHLGQHRFLKGVFCAHQDKDKDKDKDEDQHDCHRHSNSIGWKIECKCVLLHTSEIGGGLLDLEDAEAELSVAVDGAGDLNLLRHRINLHSSSSSSRRRGRRRCRTFKMCLEDIPEAQEEELSIHHQSASSGTKDDDDDDDDDDSDSDDDGVPAVDDIDIDIDMDAVEWAVDVGFWVMCLGMGFLLSRASANTFTRKTFLL